MTDNIHSIADAEIIRLKKIVERYKTMIELFEHENAYLVEKVRELETRIALHPSRQQ